MVGAVREEKESEEKEPEERISKCPKGRKVAKFRVFSRVPEDFWQWTRSKSARGCGAKHMSESKWCNTPLWKQVDILNRCTRLRHETHVEVQNAKKNTSASEHFRKLSCRKSARRCDAKRMSNSNGVAPSTRRSEHGKRTTCSDHFRKLRC